jgi:enoyl-CoA hydratase/carnithine racemase
MILVEDHGRVRVLRLNRPEKRNALNGPLCSALLAALRAADADADVAAVVLAGSGAGFSAGADLAERALLREDPAAQTARARLSLELLAAPGAMGKPVVAALHGAVVGAGATLGLVCDLAVAAEDLRLSFPEAKHDILPTLVAPTLLRHLGPKDAFDLLATGRVVGAAEALALRLVNRVVPPVALVETACALAESAALYGPASMRRVKAMINAAGEGLEPSAP